MLYGLLKLQSGSPIESLQICQQVRNSYIPLLFTLCRGIALFPAMPTSYCFMFTVFCYLSNCPLSHPVNLFVVLLLTGFLATKSFLSAVYFCILYSVLCFVFALSS